jgi:DNA invertase Pin-like site-specific DNA recombinase
MVCRYIRTSTSSQKGERYELDKTKYDLTIKDIGVSGSVPFNKREGGGKLLKMVQEGKIKEVVVEELSRLGRNTYDIFNTLHLLEKSNVVVSVRNLGLKSIIDGKKNPVWDIITSVMSSISQMEREYIKERTQMGRMVYVMKGGKLGRKVGSVEGRDFLKKEKSQQIISLLEKGKSVRDICGRLGVSSTTVCKVKRMI